MSGAAKKLLAGSVLWFSSNAFALLKAENGKSGHVTTGGRLHAFKVTGNGDPGTWKKAIHADIGVIYFFFGEIGAEGIGNVFSNTDMQTKLKELVKDETANRAIAEMEFGYWARVSADNPYSIGGRLGASFSPASRMKIQSFTAQVLAFLDLLNKKKDA